MVPRISLLGLSFWGAWLYYAHDKRTLEEVARKILLSTSARVPWVHVENMAGIEDGESAIGLMIQTSRKSRRCKKPVYTFSLNWHPKENPTKAQMIEAGRAALKVIGLDEHQAVFVPHIDRAHKHLHIIVNRVHPEKLVAANMYRDQEKLSAWSLKYEREHGQVLCVKRAENEKAREEAKAQGKPLPQEHYVDSTLEECWRKSRDGKTFKAALEAKGWGLAKGDSKDWVFVAVTKSGRAFAILRELNKGLPRDQKMKGADIDRKLADLDRSTIKSVREVQAEIEAGRGGRSEEQSQGQAQAPAPPRRRRRRKGETRAQAQEREEAESKAKAKAQEEAKERARQEERARFEVWASLQRALLQNRHIDERGQLGNRQQDERLREDKLIKEHYQKGQEAEKARLKEIEANRQRGGVLYRLTRARAELAEEQKIRLSLANAEQREQERKGALELKHDAEWKAQAEREQRRIQALEVKSTEVEARREREGVQAPSLETRREQTAGREPEASPRQERAPERSPQAERAPSRGEDRGGFERGR